MNEGTASEHPPAPVVGLGVDVGGTYSDSVLLNMETGQVLSKGKSPTTHSDLVQGVARCVGRLDQSLFPHIRLVSLSTTLATNALVEGRRSRVAAILPGYKEIHCPRDLMEDIYLVTGGHTAEGEEMAPLDAEETLRVVLATRGHVDAYAVSSYFSTRNPAHEHAVQAIIRTHAPDIPVVCGHSLSDKLNAMTRATTCILNAHLIPIIRDLLRSVKEVLRGFSIQAPLMVVKGDGSLMGDEVCARKPVETILSGPAASVVGASFLAGRETDDAVVIDVGGTTSDIAVLREGRPKLQERGVVVGPWQTHVAAVDVRTIGLGGDSQIWADEKAGIRIGPKRVVPLCMLATRHPEVSRQLSSALTQRDKDRRFLPTGFWLRTEKSPAAPQGPGEMGVLDALSRGPCNWFHLARALDTYPVALREDMIRLERRGLVRAAGFTPTDVFHVRGLYCDGDRECATLAARVLAEHLDLEPEKFMLEVKETFNRKAALEIIEALSGSPTPYAAAAEECPVCRQVWRNCFWEREPGAKKDAVGRFHMAVSIDDPIVGIGAPAHILVPPLALRLHTRALIPEHAEVANALGAIVGTILVQENVLIRPTPGKGFTGFTSAGKFQSDSLDQAIDRARAFLREYLSTEVRRAGGEELEMKITEDRRQARVASGKEMLIEVVLRGQAAAKPRFNGILRAAR
jgi:N-methylhydantoinase A/oxoprolinase/acetone carboxylase beta subunit